MQLTNILLTILCRTLSVCFTSTKIARVFNSLSCWCFLLIQFGIPTLIVIPLYVIANAKYGVKGLSVPLLLSSQDNKYNERTWAYIPSTMKDQKQNKFFLQVFLLSNI
ncbi:hypothetical protein Y032_0006g2828 [Ancylostoma ceylanicum]|uniref:Uncharacterized protein n=1 Tax=Ancylostoma ceylanicum TaxID=53326 RepID=A0A016VR00_9BILA|nr:hypothetical protein Y032_0006g2828 [Ancylostoma ceylanicum]